MEKRGDHRFQPTQNQDVTVRFLGARRGTPVQARIVNLSRNGLCLRSARPVPHGTSVQIELGGTIAYGSISRCDYERDCYEIGVELSEA